MGHESRFPNDQGSEEYHEEHAKTENFGSSKPSVPEPREINLRLLEIGLELPVR